MGSVVVRVGGKPSMVLKFSRTAVVMADGEVVIVLWMVFTLLVAAGSTVASTTTDPWLSSTVT
jgi:hypothetical protein